MDTSTTSLNLESTTDNILPDVDKRILAKLTKQVYTILDGGTITPVNIVEIVVNLMRTLSMVRDLSGPQKKAAVIYVLKEIIKDAEDDGDINETVANIADTLVPTLIDTLIGVNRRRVIVEEELHNPNHTCLSVFEKIFCCV